MPSWLRYLLMAVQLVSGILTVLLVLLHSPKADGATGIGGGATGQLFSSQRGAEATLNRITYWSVGLFFGSSFILGHYG
jgi:preprotein translocase subunit SecG